MTTFKDMTPERLAEVRAKAHESARRNRLAKKAAAVEAAAAPVEDQSLPTGYGSAVEKPPSVETSHSPHDANPADPFHAWLLALDEETKQFYSEDELRDEFAELWEQARKEKRTKKRKQARELGLSTARQHLGLLPAQRVEELKTKKLNATPVSMVIELPPAMDDGNPPDIGLRVDGNVLEHGKRISCTYGEAASYREALYRLGQHELIFKGQNTKYRAWMMQRAFAQLGGSLAADTK